MGVPYERIYSAAMSSATSVSQSSAVHNQTFRNYTHEQAARYATDRPIYPPAFIDLALKAHTSTGGELHTVLDVGCGPGQATQQLMPYFQHVIAVDPGQSMITTACSMQPLAVSASGEPARFEVCSAEDIDKLAGVASESIDVITAAAAAHWFDHLHFYAAASKVLKPKGSILIWRSSEPHFDPETTPNATEVQQTWAEITKRTTHDFKIAGNRFASQGMANLPLPWTVDVPEDQLELELELSKFDKSASWREVFNEHGKDGRFDGGYLEYRKVTLEDLLSSLATKGPITRWREAHQEQVERGEIENCIDVYRREITAAIARVPAAEPAPVLGVFTIMSLLVIKKKGRC